MLKHWGPCAVILFRNEIIYSFHLNLRGTIGFLVCVIDFFWQIFDQLLRGGRGLTDMLLISHHFGLGAVRSYFILNWNNLLLFFTTPILTTSLEPQVFPKKPNVLWIIPQVEILYKAHLLQLWAVILFWDEIIYSLHLNLRGPVYS
jgi:hypothetical protein